MSFFHLCNVAILVYVGVGKEYNRDNGGEWDFDRMRATFAYKRLFQPNFISFLFLPINSNYLKVIGSSLNNDVS